MGCLLCAAITVQYADIRYAFALLMYSLLIGGPRPKFHHRAALPRHRTDTKGEEIIHTLLDLSGSIKSVIPSSLPFLT